MKIIKGFQHKTGFHCGSTALANAAGYHGHGLSESMCFGLGEGPDFYFVKSDQSPSRAFNGRSPFMEKLFFENIGLDFEWRQGDTFPWEALKEWIDRDVPVIMLTDLYYLDYYQTSSHFSGHVVLLAGYDPESGEALLSDTEREGLQRTSLDSLARAMKSKALPFQVRNNWREIPYFPLGDLTPAISRSLAKKARAMLSPNHPRLGLQSMESFSRDLASWGSLPDWSWCARFAYQVIERRGTGGSNFRILYLNFLKEAEEHLPSLKNIKAVSRMSTIAEKWTELAMVLKEISETNPDLFPRAAETAREIAALEKAFFTNVLDNISLVSP
ncbi:MAG: BtrH N-terminal domain-containing protein [Bacillota bacterium]